MKIEVPVTRRHIRSATPRDSFKNPLCLAVKTELKRRGIAQSIVYDGTNTFSFYIERANNLGSKIHEFRSELPNYAQRAMNEYRTTGKLEPFTVVLDFQYHGLPTRFKKATNDDDGDSQEQSCGRDDSGTASGAEACGCGAANETAGDGAV